MGIQIHPRTVGVVVVAALMSLVASQLHAATDPAQPFGQAWSRLPGTAGWRMLVSAPFPRDWPPEAGRHGMPVVRYAFAMRLRPGLADGAEMGAPWARSTEADDGATTVALLEAGLDPLCIQGVRVRLHEIPGFGRLDVFYCTLIRIDRLLSPEFAAILGRAPTLVRSGQ